MRISAKVGNRLLEVEIERQNGLYVIEIDGTRYEADVHKLEADFYSILTDGKSYEVTGNIALCRCGGSANKPFCDGAHRNNGFSGDRLADTPPTTEQDRYPAEDITILDNRSVCAHIGSCTEGHPGVWRLKKEPWIKPDQAARDSIVEVIRQCPSGALSF